MKKIDQCESSAVLVGLLLAGIGIFQLLHQ